MLAIVAFALGIRCIKVVSAPGKYGHRSTTTRRHDGQSFQRTTDDGQGSWSFRLVIPGIHERSSDVLRTYFPDGLGGHYSGPGQSFAHRVSVYHRMGCTVCEEFGGLDI